MTAHIVYYNYLTPDGKCMSIGGIQTYITNLIPVLTELGYSVNIYQRSDCDFKVTQENATIYGITYTKSTWGSAIAKHLINSLLNMPIQHDDIIIYGCETCITRRIPYPTIAIQHGIFWDVEDRTPMSSISRLKKALHRMQNSWQVTRRVAKVDRLVCVDYNFVNWHRAVCVNTGVEHIVIPNFSQIPQEQPLKNEYSAIKIIFARRFFIYRGTRIFTDAIQKILAEYPNIEVTIAGDGPDSPYIHQHLDSFNNVKFITYNSTESLDIHSDKDIAVIPTIGSEGTSLSLLEAMASGCAVICTNVGGMTNIIIDHYNGLMISPNEDALYHALKNLIDDSNLRHTLQHKAYDTAKNAFSLNMWKLRWKDVFLHL